MTSKQIVGVVLVVVRCVVLVVGWHDLQLGRASTSWPTTRGTIRSAEVNEHKLRKRRSNFSVDVVYDYEAQGRAYVGTKISFGSSKFGSKESAAMGMGPYAPGKEVIVHYDPTNPERAVLIPGVTGGMRGAPWLGGLLAASGFLTFALAVRRGG